MASGVAFVHEDAGLAREIVGPAIAYQRTRYAEWGTDRDRPRPAPIREEDLPWERYLVGTPEEVVEALIELYRRLRPGELAPRRLSADRPGEEFGCACFCPRRWCPAH